MNFNFGFREMLKIIREYIGSPFDTYFVIFSLSVFVVFMLQVIGLEFDARLMFQTIMLALLFVVFRDILWRNKRIVIIGLAVCFLIAILPQREALIKMLKTLDILFIFR